jgi:DNA-binding NtrC family response regulator
MTNPPEAPDGTVLLVSRAKVLIRCIRSALNALGNVALDVHEDPADALASALGDRVILVLLDVAEADDTTGRLVRVLTASDRLVATVSWGQVSADERVRVGLNAGASNHLELPVDLGKVEGLVDAGALRARPGIVRLPTAAGQEDSADPFAFILGPGMHEVQAQLHRVVPQDTTILLTGETGTGKTRLARLIHELSPRRAEPFLVVDCGAVSPGLIESEMFGHVKGAFTGADRDRPGKLAAAGRGTLLLDEISSLPPALQAKLLRAVDDRVFEPVGSERSQPLRARLVAASNMPLDTEVAAGRFRADLYFRINVVGFSLPPLTERRGSIVPLANQFFAEFAGRNRPDVRGMSPEVLRALQDYRWPGNIRELRNVIERAVALCRGPDLQLTDLPETTRGEAHAPAPVDQRIRARPRAGMATLTETRAAAEVTRINQALQKHRNNRCRAAVELGISRMALYNKLHKYGLIHHGLSDED